MISRPKQRQIGFTLVELLVVISIIALLSSMVMYGISRARIKSRDTRRAADIKQYQTALDLYYQTCGSYPVAPGVVVLGSSTQALYTGTQTGCGDNSGTGTNGGIGTSSSGTAIVTRLVRAPSPANGSCDSTWNDYRYVSTDNNGSLDATSPAPSYRIFFCIGSGTTAYTAGPYIASPNDVVLTDFGD